MNSSISEPAGNAIRNMSAGEEMPGNATLADLSGLNAGELALFRGEWRKLDTARRRRIINRLVELAEDNVEYNFDAIFRNGLRDPDEEVRCRSIEGLWENEEASLIDPLVELLEQDESDRVQSTAAIALGKFALLAELDRLRPDSVDKVREALLGAIEDRSRSVEVIRRVLEAAAPLNLPEVKDSISDAFNSPEPGMKISAIYAMGKSCDSSWLPVLISELDNDDPEIRFEAAGACGELENEAAVPRLVKLVDSDDDIDVRMAAIQSLGRIGGPAAGECITTYLGSENDALREAAEAAIQTISASDDPLSFRL